MHCFKISQTIVPVHSLYLEQSRAQPVYAPSRMQVAHTYLASPRAVFPQPFSDREAFVAELWKFLGGVGFLRKLGVGVGFLSDSDRGSPTESFFTSHS